MIKTIRNVIITIGIIVGLKWIYDTNVNLGITRYSISYKSLPESFHGYKIAHISDFHNSKNRKIRESILQGLKEKQPHIIAITGDLIDSRRTDMKVALSLVEELVKIAPCYYVTGNHESRLDEQSFRQLEEGLTELGVEVLRDRALLVSQEDENISLIGVDDPYFEVMRNDSNAILSSEKINQLALEGLFTILLSHRPEFYEVYRNANVNLVLSGHAHGGQFRLPYVGGLFAPNQGFFPKYDGGVYHDRDFALVVSRGVGNSLFPVRINNEPELVIIELTRGSN